MEIEVLDNTNLEELLNENWCANQEEQALIQQSNLKGIAMIQKHTETG